MDGDEIELDGTRWHGIKSVPSNQLSYLWASKIIVPNKRRRSYCSHNESKDKTDSSTVTATNTALLIALYIASTGNASRHRPAFQRDSDPGRGGKGRHRQSQKSLNKCATNMRGVGTGEQAYCGLARCRGWGSCSCFGSRRRTCQQLLGIILTRRNRRRTTQFVVRREFGLHLCVRIKRRPR